MISLSELHISEYVLSQVFILFFTVYGEFDNNLIKMRFFFLSLRGRHSGKGPAAVSNLLFLIYVWETKISSSLNILKRT